MVEPTSSDTQTTLVRVPIIVKLGRKTVTIYHRPAERSRKERFTVASYATGKRRLLSFDNEKDARAKANWILTRLNEGDAAGARMTGADQAQLLSARASVAPHGLDVPTACNLFAEAARLVGPHQVVAACQAYAQRSPVARIRLPLADAVLEYLQAKRSKGRATRTLEDIASRLGIFEAAHPGKALGDFTTASLQSWLDHLKLANGEDASAQSRCNYASMLSSLFNYYRRRGNIVDNPCRDLERESPRGGKDILYWTPAEAEALLRAMPAVALPAFVVALFSGLRTAEVVRLTWANIDFERALVIVSKRVATIKNKRPARGRLSPLPLNAIEWLLPHRGAPEALVYRGPKGKLHKKVTESAKTANVRRVANGARHSCITYRVIVTGDIARVALECGNSYAKISSNYNGVATKDEGERFFNIFPNSKAS